jgi:hypothetical protein
VDRHEVADADGAHLALGEEHLQRTVGLEGSVERQRLMEEQ